MLNRVSRLLFRNGYSVFVDSAPTTVTRAIPVIKIGSQIQGMRKIGSFLEDQNTVKKLQQFDEENRDASVQQQEKQEKQEKELEEQIQIITSKKKSLWGLYNESLRTHPLLVKSITALVIVGFGDVLSQLLVSTGSFDYLRLVRMCALGGVFVGPTLHFWFLALSKLFPSKSVTTTICRVVIDQSIFTVFFLTCFFGLLLLMEGHPQDLPDKLKNDMWSVIKSNWTVWIPAQAINFWLIPPQFQVLYANVIGLAWNIYLSSVANKK